MNTKFYLFVIALIFLSSGISGQNFKIKIIETSDVHGAIFPHNFNSGKASKNSLAQVHTYVTKQRSNPDQEVILVDNGDLLQGDPSVYYYNFEKTDTTHLLSSVMNYMEYDAATVGNHDIEAGHPVYDKFNDELDFPWLAANAVNEDDGKPYFKPYHVIEKTFGNDKQYKFKIAILGMITPGIPNWLPEKIWSGINFQDKIKTAKKWIPIIKEKESPDMIIGLFHAGVDHSYDNQTADTPKNENASQLFAEQVDGFDIVFVGHDHHEWNFNVANNIGDSVLILGPQSRSRSIAIANVDLSFDSENNDWNKSVSGKIVNMFKISPHQGFMERFDKQFNLIKDYVTRPIGKFSEDLSAKESLFGNSKFVDLIHKIQLELTDADISFTAPLSIYSSIDEGEVFVKDMFELYRYENLLYTMELTGKEVDDYLEYSYSNWFNNTMDENDNLLQFVKDDDGNLVMSKRSNAPMLKNRYYNFDSAEGITYTVDVSKPENDMVEINKLSDGKKFDLNKKYTVAINSYRGNGGGGHLTRGAGIDKGKLTDRIITSTEKDLRYYMMKWIEDKNMVTPDETINWKIIPEELASSAAKNDYNLMFGTNKQK